ncbi:MAG: inositol monophosphatase [Sandaracinus sp.]|nr:inositol monophosphatase [Myxococcales bacterium]MCB9599299.1 inositol monophosphatase [Sandaracinus sp.]MCB9620529.1 inositol monophosphatase [Sandaracinus sp.]MCB9634121.1 inositol monophosphatase [Sandaracinus sp.]
MTPVELQHALDVARDLADEASALAIESYRRGATVQKKGVVDLVTETDLAVEALLRARLGAAFPEHDLVGEEGEDVTRGARPTWYVDPIDGTTNFAHGHPHFAVSIGLAVDDVPVLGVIAAPALGVVWSGAVGLGATRCWKHARGERVEACRVSTNDSLRDALCATGFPYDRWTNDDDNTTEARAFLKRGQGLRRCGAAALDCCFVADGTYDLYWERTLKPWDVCAGIALIVAAGGKVSDYAGGVPELRRGELVATNGRLHEATLEVLRGVRG